MDNTPPNPDSAASGPHSPRNHDLSTDVEPPIRSWCCQTTLPAPHTPGCRFEPREDQPIDYGGTYTLASAPTPRCPSCRIHHPPGSCLRYQPIGETLREVLADADLAVTYARGGTVPIPDNDEPADWAELMKNGPGALCVLPDTEPEPASPIPDEALAIAEAYDGMFATLLGVRTDAIQNAVRAIWLAIVGPRWCHCIGEPHRWNCPMTPIWADTVLAHALDPQRRRYARGGLIGAPLCQGCYTTHPIGAPCADEPREDHQ